MKKYETTFTFYASNEVEAQTIIREIERVFSLGEYNVASLREPEEVKKECGMKSA